MEIKTNKDIQDLKNEYEKIIPSCGKENAHIWNNSSDYFQQFSTYDENYIPVPTLGNTTPLNIQIINAQLE